MERDIEDTLLFHLKDKGYTLRDDIRDRAALDGNFRKHFEALNQVHLSDAEFARLLDSLITSDVYTASHRLRNVNTFEREDGTPLDYTLVNTQDWCKNAFEVVHQLRMNTASSHHRYDVILLLNGVPVVQIELKDTDVSARRAIEQIDEYKRDAGNSYTNSLQCFLQIFVVSNDSNTWYFANNNPKHFSFNADERFLPVYRYAHPDNSPIKTLKEFTNTFLSKCTLAGTISRYIVLVATEQKLLIMRPYQIYAVKAIMECIHENSGNGYIWHTTGSGKTLTSFKASTLIKDIPKIHKCLFVVDRKDLDKQTRDEFNRFQDGCVEANTHTGKLVQRLLSDDYTDKVIVTTIQKLGLALDESARGKYRERLKPLRDKRFVFIFDECHRSQFGDNHQAIKDFFPNSQLFGFTGTPIFPENASCTQIEGQQASPKTTEDLFERCLHQYTITNAIDDQNVLRFHADYFRWEGGGVEQVSPDGTPLSKEKVVRTILEKHDAATLQRRFNALFATQSIPDAIAYYDEFRRIQAEKLKKNAEYRPLQIACLFSPPAYGNPEVKQMQEELPQEQEDNRQDPESKKAALARIIADYNAQYGSNHSLAEFDLYYTDVQGRIKSHEWSNRDVPADQKIDITIVVDMLLTGFDSKYLNTLYVDKNLRYHGLIQAFSRTNRILNDAKPYGNILDFRSQQDAVEEALTLFSGQTEESAGSIWLVPPVAEIIDDLAKANNNLESALDLYNVEPTPNGVDQLKGDTAKVLFVQKFKEVQRLVTQIKQYTDITPEEEAKVDAILPKQHYEGYRSRYLEMARQFRAEKQKPDTQPDPSTDNLEFDLVLFASNLIDYDYIMKLLARMTEEGEETHGVTREKLIEIIRGEAKFLDEQDELIAYVHQLETNKPLTMDAVMDGYQQFKRRREQQVLSDMAAAHGIAEEALTHLVEDTLRRHVFDGEVLSDLFRNQDLGWKARVDKEKELMVGLAPLLRKLAKGQDISGLSAYD